MGERVVLVDADLRRSAVARAFDLNGGAVGLTEVLADTITLPDALQDTDVPGLQILASGATPPNPSELLGSHRMEQLVEELSQRYFVILDAPPLLPVTDAVLLTRSADAAVLVVAAGRTHKEALDRARHPGEGWAPRCSVPSSTKRRPRRSTGSARATSTTAM
ncbi:CpsD/CapB family tyrosine-protein kinase [Janibacter indicus]